MRARSCVVVGSVICITLPRRRAPPPISDVELDGGGELGSRRLDPVRQETAGPEAWRGDAAPQHLLCHRDLVAPRLARRRCPSRARACQSAINGHLVRHAERAVQVQRAVYDVAEHAGHRDLDRCDLAAHLARVRLVLVDQPGGVQHVKPELRDLHVGVGDLLLGELLLRSSSPLVRRLSARSHIMSRARFSTPDRAHRVVDATAAEPGLRDLESLAGLTEQVRGGHAAIA